MVPQRIPVFRRLRSAAGPRVRSRLLAALAAILGGLPLTALAGDLTVRVLGKATGQPLPEASVCLGTSADPLQLGAQRTSAEGRAQFRNLPAAPLSLIVSGSGYRSEQRSLPASPLDRELTLLLGKGPSGPFSCQAGPVPTAPEPQQARSFQLDRGAGVTTDRVVTLNFASGDATQYRASESRNFKDAPWRPIEGTPRFELSAGAGRKTVYLQLRRYREMEGATLETRSDVLSDNIRLR